MTTTYHRGDAVNELDTDEKEALAEAIWPVDPPLTDPGLRILHRRVTAAVERILIARLADE